MSQHPVDMMNDSRVGQYMDEIEKELLIRHLPSQALRVLDLGGGTGRWSSWLIENNHWQALTDIDPSVLKIAQERHPKLNIMRAGAEHIPFPAEAFDVVLAVQLFDYLDNRTQFLQEARRVLKPNGLLMLSWTNKRSIKGWLYDAYSKWKGSSSIDRVRFYETAHRDNLALLLEANFTILEAIGYSWMLLPRIHNSGLVGFFIAIERTLRLNQWLAASPSIISVAQKEKR